MKDDLKVVSAWHVTGHVLRITFNDGHKSTVDFGKFIFATGNPLYEVYKDKSHFLTYDILHGNLNWDDYTMIFSVEDLYTNKIVG